MFWSEDQISKAQTPIALLYCHCRRYDVKQIEHLVRLMTKCPVATQDVPQQTSYVYTDCDRSANL